MARVKRSQRRMIKRPHNPGGRRPEQKPRDGREQAPKIKCSGGCGALRRSWNPWACTPCHTNLTEKWCPRCEEVKPREAFYFKHGRLSSNCISCNKEQARASVARWRNYSRARSEALVQEGPDVEQGQCRAFINLGSFRHNIRCSFSAAPGTGGFCLRHAPTKVRKIASQLNAIKAGRSVFGSDRWRGLSSKVQAEQLEAARIHPGLAELLGEQERDNRWGHRAGNRWEIPLDAVFANSDSHETLGMRVTDRGWDEDPYGFVMWKVRQPYTEAWWVDVVIEKADREREWARIDAERHGRVAA